MCFSQKGAIVAAHSSRGELKYHRSHFASAVTLSSHSTNQSRKGIPAFGLKNISHTLM
jgi:hypothetical protein